MFNEEAEIIAPRVALLFPESTILMARQEISMCF